MAGSSIDYDFLRQEQAAKLDSGLNNTLKMKTENVYRRSSIRVIVLKKVVSGEFDEAEKCLEEFYETYSSYKEFQEKVNPYLTYCKGIVRSIKVKKNFPNKEKLPGIRQKELVDKIVRDYNDLRMNLTRIEGLKTEALFKDSLSIRIFLRTFMICASLGMSLWLTYTFFDYGFDFVFHVAESIGQKVAESLF